MGVGSGEIAIWLREARIFLDREKKLRDCLVEAAADEVRAADYSKTGAEPGSRAETQRPAFRDSAARL